MKLMRMLYRTFTNVSLKKGYVGREVRVRGRCGSWCVSPRWGLGRWEHCTFYKHSAPLGLLSVESWHTNEQVVLQENLSAKIRLFFLQTETQKEDTIDGGDAIQFIGQKNIRGPASLVPDFTGNLF